MSLCRKTEVPMRLVPTVMATLCAFACTAGIAANNRLDARRRPAQVDGSALRAGRRAGRRLLICLPRSAPRSSGSSKRRGSSTRCSCGSARPATNRRSCNCLADDTPLGRARLSYFLLNKGPWSELDEDRAVRARRRREAARRQLLSGGRDARGSRCLDESAAGRAARSRDRILHDDPPHARTAS